MLSYLVFVITCSLVIVNTAFCSLPILILSLLKLVLPMKAWQQRCTQLANRCMWLWATVNHGILSLVNPKLKWQIEGVDELKMDGWYLMISNHLSWTDIVVLCSVFRNRIPIPKFFLKQQLLYVPFLGMACWALDMPFMKRYSREYLVRHPEKRGQDLETTRRACAKFKDTPTTVVNYVEGTRFTPQKRQATRSEFEYLLRPKTGGIAYTLASMGELFDNIIDVTVAYPDNTEQPFKSALMGKMERIVVKVKVLPIDEQVSGDYFNDKPFKRQFQQWLSELWKQKDIELQQIHNK
ncbi:acyltransferase [Vibrio hippocampi]|uniref:Acyltransferase YihG n=1 Tax=Vibrio hippocampi TaxID=654686 RepID=A0ABM8ZD98_9VIBR|nr:acyltransferase [Vibrio hippocampi]CAH0524260.1 putative acyltransferase YihG [Vibrio hippocampi]